jgi:hypothetical protein
MEMIRKIKGAIVADSGSQIKFARKVDIENTRLSRIINGWTKPRPEEISKLREVLGAIVDETFGEQ